MNTTKFVFIYKYVLSFNLATSALMTATTGDPGSAILASEINSQLISFLDPCMYPTHCSVNTHLAMQFFLVGAWQLAMVWNELTDRFSYLPKCKARTKKD